MAHEPEPVGADPLNGVFAAAALVRSTCYSGQLLRKLSHAIPSR